MRGMSPTRRNLLYLLAALGLAIPWTYNLAYLMGGGSFAPGPFMAAVGVNALTTGITWDVYLAAIAFSVWLLGDARARGERHAWVYVVLCFGVGLAFALPLYLARRRA